MRIGGSGEPLSFGARVQATWRTATQPDDAVTDREDRRRARALCNVALALALLLSLSSAISLTTTILLPDPEKSLGYGGTAIVAAAAGAFWISWRLSLRPNFELGAWATIIVIDAFLVGLAPFFDVSAPLALGFAVPVLCATIFLDARGTIAMFFLAMTLSIVMLFTVSPDVVEFSFIVGIMIAVVGLTVLVALIREDDLRSIKRLREFERADAERLRGELELARRVQMAMLPDHLPEVPGLDIAAFSEPAFEASGDFYDVFPIDHGTGNASVGIVVCDVAGKGVASALIMSATRAALRAEAEHNPSPGSVLEKVNRTLAASVPDGLFVTIFYGVYDAVEQVLHFASAGHPHPYRWRASHAAIDELASHGMPLGLMADSEYEEQSTKLDDGDFVVIYTDGLVEALNAAREMYGFGGVEAQLRDHATTPGSASDRVDHCLASMRSFIGAERLHDDVTLVALACGGIVDLTRPVGAERDTCAASN